MTERDLSDFGPRLHAAPDGPVILRGVDLINDESVAALRAHAPESGSVLGHRITGQRLDVWWSQ